MRIGLISSGTPKDRIPPIYGGGIQKYIWHLAEQLNRRGHEVHIFTHRQLKQLKLEVFRGIYVHRIPHVLNMNFFSTFLFGFKVVFELLKVQKRAGRFHILHAQSRVSALVLQTFFPFKIPILFTAHNWDVALTVPGAFMPYLLYQFLFHIEKRAYEKSAGIISLTKYFRKIIINKYKIAPSKIRVIPNMTERPTQAEEKVGVRLSIQKVGDNPYLLFIGRLESEKGLIFLLKTFNQLCIHEGNLNLVIIGEGSLKEALNKLTNTLESKSQVHILGSLHESQVKFLLKRAKALILPSQFEIMPTILLEAWAVGCPVIVRDYYGVSALIHHNQTGLIFNDSETLSKCVQQLLSNEGLLQTLKKNAEKQLHSQYIAPLVAEQIISEYQALLNR